MAACPSCGAENRDGGPESHAGRPGDARAALQRALEFAKRKGATVLIEKAGRRLADLDAH
jgi:hypothetical protein